MKDKIMSEFIFQLASIFQKITCYMEWFVKSLHITTQMCPPQKKKSYFLCFLKLTAPRTGAPFSLMGLEVGEILKYVSSRSLKSFCWNRLSPLLHLWPSPPSCLFSPIFVPLGFVATLSFSISSQNTLLHPQVLSFLIPSLLTPASISLPLLQ